MVKFHDLGAPMLTRILFAASLLTLSACAMKAPVAFSPSDACTVSSPTYDTREVQCQFPKTGHAQKYRLKANFSGGHDDTMARLESFIDNSPLHCDEGSKTDLFAEDGDVSLWCTFSVAAQSPGSGVFKATIRWSHAEYVSYEVLAQ